MACEAFLNLYNRRDEALRLYPFLFRSGHRHALGQVGLSTDRDFDRLGPLAARYAEFDVHDELRRSTPCSTPSPTRRSRRRIAPYIFNPNPDPPPAQAETLPRNIPRCRGRFGRIP